MIRGNCIMSKKIALIVGVGHTTGQSLCRKLAGKYRLVMIARSGGFITSLAETLPDAHAYICDVGDRNAWSATLRQIAEEIGQPNRILINTEKAAWGEYNTLSLDDFSMVSGITGTSSFSNLQS